MVRCPYCKQEFDGEKISWEHIYDFGKELDQVIYSCPNNNCKTFLWIGAEPKPT
jgi:aspartate carbamoyltransferase regulatory subunit